MIIFCAMLGGQGQKNFNKNNYFVFETVSEYSANLRVTVTVQA